MSFCPDLFKLHDRSDIKKRRDQRTFFGSKKNCKVPPIFWSKRNRLSQMIFRIFFVVIFICGPVFANESIDEINARLIERKKELEPFDQSKVKVDVESLGLDDVDKKSDKDNSPTPLENSVKVEAKNENLIKEEKKDEQLKTVKKTEIISSKKSDKKYLNQQKKRNLAKRLERDKRRKENARKQSENLRKFEELRQRYLVENKENEIGEAINSEEKILPRKKDLNPFLNEDLPALPILNRYRTSENIHIPPILTVKERIDLLFSTISSGDVLAFNEAYKNVGNPNVKNPLGDTILTYSILLRRYPIIASIIEKGADVNMPNKLGYTPLNIAIELLDFKSFEMLAINKADLDELDNFGRSYLIQAARVGFLPAVDFLVDQGADVNLMDNDGFTALAVAYRHKKEVIAQYLLKHGAKTWIEKPYDAKTQSLIQELENRWR